MAPLLVAAGLLATVLATATSADAGQKSWAAREIRASDREKPW